MNYHKKIFYAALVGLLLGAGVANADGHLAGPERMYRVTIENLSGGQALTPPLITTHNHYVQLYQVGEPASAAIQAIAENGNLEPLQNWLSSDANVADVMVGDTGPLVPSSNPGGTDFGSSVSLMIGASHRAHYLSFVSMLICTNDGFTGLSGVALPEKGSRVLFVSGYDAGTETNSEDFADLVPPCQGLLGVASDDEGTGASNPALAEGGVIHYHEGIQGGNDLLADVHSWDNPVAKITITRISDSANRFTARLSGAGEVPTVATFASGLIDLRVDWEHSEVHYSLYGNGISGVTAAHIHAGLPSENGGPVAFVYGPTPATGLVEGMLSKGVIGEGDLLNGDFEDLVMGLRYGELYVNVHTADHGPGEIRGQIGVVGGGHPMHGGMDKP